MGVYSCNFTSVNGCWGTNVELEQPISSDTPEEGVLITEILIFTSWKVMLPLDRLKTWVNSIRGTGWGYNCRFAGSESCFSRIPLDNLLGLRAGLGIVVSCLGETAALAFSAKPSLLTNTMFLSLKACCISALNDNCNISAAPCTSQSVANVTKIKTKNKLDSIHWTVMVSTIARKSMALRWCPFNLYLIR